MEQRRVLRFRFYYSGTASILNAFEVKLIRSPLFSTPIRIEWTRQMWAPITFRMVNKAPSRLYYSAKSSPPDCDHIVITYENFRRKKHLHRSCRMWATVKSIRCLHVLSDKIVALSITEAFELYPVRFRHCRDIRPTGLVLLTT
jgi:hypothetical protein